MRVLFIVPYPTEGPSNRYRIEQYLPYLKQQGVEYSLRPFISSDFFRILYKRGNQIKKTLYFLSSIVKRLCDLINFGKYDLVFVHIESFPFGPAIFEYIFAKLNKSIIYDFEDAVYLPNFRGNNKFVNYIRSPKKFYQILKLSSHVIVCNKYMKDFVSAYNENVTVIPTSIDTAKFKLKNYDGPHKKLTIGWIGSHTTAYCLKSLTGVFQELTKKYDFCLKVIGGGQDFNLPGVDVINEEWSLSRDVENFQQLDIGIYPLPDDERARAKTPFKTIQYMSVGLPCIASRVGGNLEIIQDGINGFLVLNEEEWISKLSLLIEDSSLRKALGLAGRKMVEERYSIRVNAPIFFRILQNTYNARYKNRNK